MPNTRNGAARCIRMVRCKPSLGGPRSLLRLILMGFALRFRSEGVGKAIETVRALAPNQIISGTDYHSAAQSGGATLFGLDAFRSVNSRSTNFPFSSLRHAKIFPSLAKTNLPC